MGVNRAAGGEEAEADADRRRGRRQQVARHGDFGVELGVRHALDRSTERFPNDTSIGGAFHGEHAISGHEAAAELEGQLGLGAGDDVAVQLEGLFGYPAFDEIVGVGKGEPEGRASGECAEADEGFPAGDERVVFCGAINDFCFGSALCGFLPFYGAFPRDFHQQSLRAGGWGESEAGPAIRGGGGRAGEQLVGGEEVGVHQRHRITMGRGNPIAADAGDLNVEGQIAAYRASGCCRADLPHDRRVAVFGAAFHAYDGDGISRGIAHPHVGRGEVGTGAAQRPVR